MTKILVIGSGAVGGLYAGKLWQAGAKISLICRSDYEQVKKNGLEIKSLWGDFNFKADKVLKDVSEYKEEPDFIIIATKVLPEIDLPKLIKPVLTKKTSIILIQNGIFIEDDLAKAFPNHHLISVIAFVATKKEKAALIEHDSDGKLIIGEYQNPNQKKTQQIINLWEESKVPCFQTDKIQYERWKKLLWNASFNPISVIAGRLDTKQILDDENLANLVKEVMKEVAILAKIQGYDLDEKIIDETIKATKERKNPAKTSMLLDFEAGRKMEFEAILGNALKFAQKNSINSPLLKDLYKKIFNL